MVSILYIEDDALNQRILTQVVRDYLHYPAPVIWEDTAHLEERLKNLGETHFDLILVDLGIGPLDGVEALPYLRKHPPFATSKIVAFTATLDDWQVWRMRQAGFDGSLAKPLDISTLEEVLQTILKGQAVWQV
ncbi:MAG: response regulator [Anaerolineae bacterium]|nr:response regulator [Anaerolineae bacterium]MDW8173956.1 response regulator [Anaerolineae bacterium]